jgi:hypothetical protein
MPPRQTADFGALVEALVEGMRIQVAASVDKTLGDFNRRVSRLERRVEQFSEGASPPVAANKRRCTLCDNRAVARGLCSAHYQQWRYRERKVHRIDRAFKNQERMA